MRSVLVLTFAVFLSAPQARASRDEKRKHRTYQNLDLSEGLRSILEKFSTNRAVNGDTVDNGEQKGEATSHEAFKDCHFTEGEATEKALDKLAKCVEELNRYQNDQVSKAFKESGESNIKFEEQYNQALSLLNKIKDTAGLENAKKEDTRRATNELISKLEEVKSVTEGLKGRTIMKPEKVPEGESPDQKQNVQGESPDQKQNVQGEIPEQHNRDDQGEHVQAQDTSLLAEATSDEKQDEKPGDGVSALEVAAETQPKGSGEQGNEGSDATNEKHNQRYGGGVSAMELAAETSAKGIAEQGDQNSDATNEKHDQRYGGGVSALEVAAETSPRSVVEQGDQISDVDGNNRDRQKTSAGSSELKMNDLNLPGLSIATMGQE